jgi:hypothetical protein
VTPLFFEPCLTLVYRSTAPVPRVLGRTVVTGDFMSMMPFWRQGQLLFNLTSVRHTPLGRFDDAPSARAFVAAFEKDEASLRYPTLPLTHSLVGGSPRTETQRV